MNNREIHIGENIANSSVNKIDGGFVDIDNSRYYKISKYDFSSFLTRRIVLLPVTPL